MPIVFVIKTKLEINNQQKQEIVVKYQEKETCPFDCCINDDYKTKLCNEGYECKINKCEILDSDGDGLSDLEEKSIGANPKVFDTDGDTLSDFEEVKNLKTNPLSKNTDGDRYNDDKDKEPLIKNSAKLELSSEEIVPSLQDFINLYNNVKNLNIKYIFDYAQTKDLIVTIKNLGDDYTEGFSFNIDTYVVFIKKVRSGLSCVDDKLLLKEKIGSQTFKFEDTVKPSQELKKANKLAVINIPSSIVPNDCTELLSCGCSQKISYVFDNVNYEKY